MQYLASQLPTVDAIDEYLRSLWVVVPDPDYAEYVRGPRLQLENFQHSGHYIGDCDDAATFAASLLIAAQIPNTLVAYRFQGNPEFSHVNVEAYPGYQIDPIVPLELLPISGAIEILPVEVL